MNTQSVSSSAIPSRYNGPRHRPRDRRVHIKTPSRAAARPSVENIAPCIPYRHPVRMLFAVIALLMGGAFAGGVVYFSALIGHPLVEAVGLAAGGLLALIGVALALVPIEWGLEPQSD